MKGKLNQDFETFKEYDNITQEQFESIFTEKAVSSGIPEEVRYLPHQAVNTGGS